MVLLAVLAVLFGIHLIRQFLPDDTDAWLLAHFAFVPGRLTFAVDPGSVLGQISASQVANASEADRIEVARFFLGDGTPQPWSVLTYALLHGNWTHVALNGIWLLAFGSPVARRFGSGRFLLFFVAGALAGAATHYALFPLSLDPLIGASAGVSACMGAALRFIFQPSRPVSTGAPEGLSGAASVPILDLLRDRRAVAFFLAWFLTNLATGIGAVAFQLAGGPIAWQAHIGGFLLGLLGFGLFDPVRPVVEGEPSPTPEDVAEPD